MNETSVSFSGFTKTDFDVFRIPGLEQRMEALRANVQPKFREIGQALVGDVSALMGEPCYVHIAKHARRTVNPPNDSWLSFATSPRGYKMLPHFQIGLWATHAFVQFAMIYECPRKQEFGKRLLETWDELEPHIPEHYLWFDDHMNPKPIQHSEMGSHIEKMAERLMRTKKAELLCGIQIPWEQAAAMTGKQFLDLSYRTIQTLMPLYRLLAPQPAVYEVGV
jgi:uncharacterized protein YktB (UPF0637 family)